MKDEIEKLLTKNEESEKKNNLIILKEIFSNKSSIINCLYFIFSQIFYAYCEYGTSMELEALGGNIYLNTMFFAFLEAVTISMLIYFMFEDKRRVLMIVSVFASLFFGAYFLSPKNLQTLNGSFAIFLRLCALCGKSMIELIFNLNFIYSSNLFKIEHLGVCCQISVFFNRFFSISIPYFNYFSIKIVNIHPFAFYSLFWIFNNILLLFVKEISGKKKYDDIQSLSLKFDSGNSTPLIMKSRCLSSEEIQTPIELKSRI